jgi:hypothetical protein
VVFTDDVAVVYSKQGRIGMLTFYVDGVITSEAMVDDNLSLLFHRYSLVRVADGVLYKEYGGKILYFKTQDHSFAR